MAGKGKSLGLLISKDPRWVAGYNYCLNILKSLSFLSSDKMPRITILHLGERPDLGNLSCLNLEYENISGGNMFGDHPRMALVSRRKFKHKVDVLYPAYYPMPFFSGQAVYWIPDLQHEHHPQLFNRVQLLGRRAIIKAISSTRSIVVFSSDSAKKDFCRLYPKNKNNLKVLHFRAVLEPAEYEAKIAEIVQIKGKYSIKENYFICSNQLWKHKDHLTVLQSVKILKERGISVSVVFTGNLEDYRVKGYYNTLIEYVDKNNIKDAVKFLGMISRHEQLVLMKEAFAVVQPSLFEGWNTSIEEAKFLRKPVIASDIDVHREQQDENCYLFRAGDQIELANLMESFVHSKPSYKKKDYDKLIRDFAEEFIKIIEEA